MLSQRRWFTILLMTLCCVCLGYFTLQIYQAIFIADSVTDEKILDRKTESSELVDHQSPPLSRHAEYPSPVIQLQQTVTDGLLKDNNNHLPLLHGDLADFSQNNIRKQYAQSDELLDLKQRLQQLKSVAHPER
ncbi:hypothetical protein [Vibrio spartinae]|uniref:Uncharacterized protein n=1 Tax=Vibrio spartinae TaxID=1918945 RepID=A0A1N6M2B2_9VIBR|nr:hypothetical protein [Vibrio spartinae]SIO93588.1 hypothetical protein VSP9026_01258 [Vibrio spartinae]